MRSNDIEHQVATAFAGDVTEHRMIVRLDQGLHRHLVFEQREHSWNNRFELITVPGSLTVTGDRGAYTFRRLADMFQFFRSRGWPYGINASYWAEKLVDGRRSVQVYGEHVLKQRLDQALAEWPDQYQVLLDQYEHNKARWDESKAFFGQRPTGMFSEPEAPKTVDEIRQLIRDHDEWGSGVMYEDGARELLGELEKVGVVSDTYEWDLRDYDYHFLWCLHAIAWGVRQYDRAVKTGLHIIRTGPIAWDTPLPTVAPERPAPLPVPDPAGVKAAVVAGGVL